MGTIKYRRRGRAAPPPDEIHPALWRHLVDAEEPFDVLPLKFGDITSADIAAAWERYSIEIVAKFARDKPGTRPNRWWCEPGRERRQRLGGAGIAREEFTYLGVHFIYDGRSLRLSDLTADPPTFESQGSFLQRTNQLLRGELARLRDSDFLPERIEIERPTPDEFCPLPGCGHYLHVCGWRYHRTCPHCGGSYRGLRERI